ncbi:MAG: alpha-ribazole phosphatase [Acidobacteria bacterium]|nr:alpha-ribazole phosphatase [Acidobacteriota bacterium]
MTNISSPAISRMWLVRHGETESEARGRCYGRLDLALSLKGRRQAELVAQRLSKESLAAIYASPRRRARESAAPIGAVHDLPVEVLEELCEINFGDFEGLTYEEIQRRYPERYRHWMEHPTEIQFPNGESFTEMRNRVVNTAATLRECHLGESIAIVSHGGVNRILLAEALGVAPANIFRIAQRYAALNLISYSENMPLVELVNEVTLE